jgi:D-threo-aldose 1-dehydrogenase
MTGYSPHGPLHGPLGAGSAPLGNLGTVVPEEDAVACLAAAWDAGIRHYDTAPHYGAGLAEHRLGHALRGRPRDAYTLSTKVGRLLSAAPEMREMSQGFAHALPFRRTFDYTAAGTVRSLEDSQQRMGLNRFDIVYIHDCAEDWHGPAWKERFSEAMTGAAAVLSAMRERGEIRAWGMGLNLVEPALACLEAARPDIFLIAGRYTLLDHTALGQLFPACAARGVKVVLGGPYNSGLLAGGTTFNYEPAKAEVIARADAIRAVCQRHGADIKAAALQFCAAHPVVAAVIPGPRTAAEVQQNAALMRAEIPGALWAELRGAGLLPENAPTPQR